MQKKKEKFLDKVIKKNYNNELEQILEKKNFTENTKNILLSMLYKIEVAYDDYQQVKKDVMPKDKFLQNIIKIIKNDIDEIEIVRINSKEAEILGEKSFKIDKKNRKIVCYPIERILLYCISKISENDKIIKDKYQIIDKTISDLLLIGNNINTVEPIRDFNGFSWDIVTKDINSIEHNLVYQSIRILVGEDFLNKWIYNREFIIDYFDLFKNRLEKLYGEEMANEVIDNISKLSVLLQVKYNQEKVAPLMKHRNEVEEKLNEISDKEVFIKNLTRQKKDLNKKIRKIDTIINDKKLLQKEYEQRNEMLPLDKKIFSMKVLAKMMQKERDELCNKINKQNNMLNPQKFVKYEKNLEDQYQYLRLVDIENNKKELAKAIIEFEKVFMECYKIKISNAKQKEDIIRVFEEFRYYLNLPYTENKSIKEFRNIEKKEREVKEILITKLVNEKVIARISNDANTNLEVLQSILNTKIICLEKANMKILKENDKLYLVTFDENVFDEKIEIGYLSTIDTNNLLIKFNKTVKIFNN